MNPESAPPSLPRRVWSRRWVRRLTYALAGGAALVGASTWALRQPYVDRLLVAKLDALIREETGLGFQAERLELHLFQGRIVLHQVALGGDLLQARRVELDLDLPTLLRVVHVRRFLLEGPRLNLDARRLAAIRLKEHPPGPKASWRVDRVEILDGQAQVDEPAWGVRKGVFAFRVDGRGRLLNQLWLDIRIPRLALGEGSLRTQGEASLKFRYTDKGVDSVNIQAHVGDSALSVLGSCQFATRVVQAEAAGALNLEEILRLVPGQPAYVSGFLDFKGKVQGPLSAAAWNLTLDGRRIKVKETFLQPGTLHLAALGGPGRIHLDALSWESPEGKLRGAGGWARATGTSLELNGESIAFVPASIHQHLDFLGGLTGRFTVEASLPSAPWAAPDLQKLAVSGTAQFFKGGQKVGGAAFSVADKHLSATELDLQLPEAGFTGSASATLTRKGLGGIEAEGELTTDAGAVADALDAWDVTRPPLDMSGPARAHATFRWDPQGGVVLDGQVDVDTPRWHGAHGDRLAATVSMRGDVLRVTDIELEKGEGRAWGDVWITWAPGPPEAEGIDMCFRAFRLPIEEGLKAGDQGDLAITGTAGGWARLHGPLKDITLEGQAVTEGALVYGLRVPAASAAISLGIKSLRLRATDVRVADSLDHLQGAPGPLDLRGSMDMDARNRHWTVAVEGDVDSGILGLGGPLIQGRVEGRLDGPLTAPLGPSQAPEGAFTLTRGRLSMEGESIDGIEARLTFRDGLLQAQAGLPDRPTPVVAIEALQTGPGRLAGNMRVLLGSESADTASVSTRLSRGFLKDLNLDYQGHGEWSPMGLSWQGQLKEFTGTFQGFSLNQTRPCTFRGDTTGMALAMDLEGRALGPQGSSQSTTMSLGGWIPFAPDGALDVQLGGSAELANLKAILDHLAAPGQYSLMADMKPAGTASFDLTVGGRPAEPTLEGTLELRGGRLSERTYPQSIENVDFTALFHGRDVTIPQEAPLHGTLAQGALTAWGRVTWGSGGLTDYDFNANLDDFQFRDMPEGLEIQGDFNGSLRGNDADGGRLKGTLRAKSLLYQADINLTDIIMAGSMGGASSLNSLDPSDPLSRIEMELDLQMSRPWECDTNLFKLQGRPSGTFMILGTLAHPGLKGRMDFLPGGRITNLLPAGDLVLERGSLVFSDPAVFNPILDFHGRVDVDPYLVTLDVTGALDAINAHPSSTPALRPDQIFTILVDPSAASRMDTTQSASAQSAVSTGVFNQGAGLVSSLFLANGLERIRKTLTLDRVNFSILGGPNLSLTLEKSFDVLGHRMPWITSYKQEGTQTTYSGNVEWRFGNLVLQLGARQITGSSQTTGDTTVQGVTPSGEIRYTWSPK